MELLSRDRTICGGLFAAQRVRNRRLSKPNTVVIRRAGYGALGRLDRVRGVRFLRLTRHAAGGPAQPEMTLTRLCSVPANRLGCMSLLALRLACPTVLFRPMAPVMARGYTGVTPP